MTSRYGNSLMKASGELLALFALDKSGNRTGEFPYGQSDEEVIKTFRQACGSRESYLKFVELYKRLVRGYEVHIKAQKLLHSHFVFMNQSEQLEGIDSDLSDIQSVRARMSNEVTKLIYLRRIGKKWRHQENMAKLTVLSA